MRKLGHAQSAASLLIWVWFPVFYKTTSIVAIRCGDFQLRRKNRITFRRQDTVDFVAVRQPSVVLLRQQQQHAGETVNTSRTCPSVATVWRLTDATTTTAHVDNGSIRSAIFKVNLVLRPQQCPYTTQWVTYKWPCLHFSNRAFNATSFIIHPLHDSVHTIQQLSQIRLTIRLLIKASAYESSIALQTIIIII